MGTGAMGSGGSVSVAECGRGVRVGVPRLGTEADGQGGDDVAGLSRAAIA